MAEACSPYITASSQFDRRKFPKKAGARHGKTLASLTQASVPSLRLTEEPMSKADHGLQSPARRGSRKHGVSPRHHQPRTPCASTPDLIARIWETLEWHKTLQAALLITVAGIACALLLAVLEVSAHTSGGQAAALPVGITVTATVSYRAARRKRR
jgi:hypothetical protein